VVKRFGRLNENDIGKTGDRIHTAEGDIDRCGIADQRSNSPAQRVHAGQVTLKPYDRADERFSDIGYRLENPSSFRRTEIGVSLGQQREHRVNFRGLRETRIRRNNQEGQNDTD